MKEIMKIKDKADEHSERFNASITQKLIRMSNRINKYINKLEKFY